MPVSKRDYARPSLTVHGDVDALTNGGTGSNTDGIGGSQLVFSDRERKDHIAPVDPQEILRRAVALPIATWNYKDDPSAARHIGPMAQDFAAAFQVGHDNRLINPVDTAGVSLAAVQALAQNVEQQQAEIARLRAEVDALKGARRADEPDVVA
ncbi:MAG TPA: tail fiber domain-containing protein [Thermomicrobiales bacterium]|jgi:uncharacterized small protein (DUF1192 family)